MAPASSLPRILALVSSLPNPSLNAAGDLFKLTPDDVDANIVHEDWLTEAFSLYCMSVWRSCSRSCRCLDWRRWTGVYTVASVKGAEKLFSKTARSLNCTVASTSQGVPQRARTRWLGGQCTANTARGISLNPSNEVAPLTRDC
ncbi:hypothetical protein BKA70DRAFT_402546 [Coprinopsis sp. MPI-PUGE-AT-0042]|nr:hypothetical protein BKA70DRAFT_402546 [Coprinopsis sp. MPI-PUGE-AT-0042]